jgi:hypothetical protein
MKKTFQVRITLADGAVHIRKVSARSAVELFDRVQALAKQFPTYVRSEGTLLKEKP